MGHQTWSLTTAKVVNQDIVNKKWPKNTTESTEGTIQNGNAPIMAATELIGKAFGLNLQFHGCRVISIKCSFLWDPALSSLEILIILHKDIVKIKWDQIHKSVLSHKNYSVIFPEQEVWKTIYRWRTEMISYTEKRKKKGHLHEHIFSQWYYSLRHVFYSSE